MSPIEETAKRWRRHIGDRTITEGRTFAKNGNPWLIGAIAFVAVLLWQGLEFWSNSLDEKAAGKTAPVVLPPSLNQVSPSYFSGSVEKGPLLPRTRGSDDPTHRVDDLFRGRARSAEARGASFWLVGARGDLACASAVWGRELPGLMRAAECTEVFRGLYRDAGRHINGNISIFNLKDREGTRLIIDTLQNEPAIGFVYALANDSPDTVASALWATGTGRGHFLFIHGVWRDEEATANTNNTVAEIPGDLVGASTALSLTGLDIALKLS